MTEVSVRYFADEVETIVACPAVVMERPHWFIVYPVGPSTILIERRFFGYPSTALVGSCTRS